MDVFDPPGKEPGGIFSQTTICNDQRGTFPAIGEDRPSKFVKNLTDNSSNKSSVSNENAALNVVPTNNAEESFANALKKDYCFPKKEQAIVFNAIEGVKIGQYILELSKVVAPQNVLFTSRLSNNRVCIFLSSKTIVDNFMTNHAAINIKDVRIPVRRLSTPGKRVIISNVFPYVPHSVVEDVLKANGLKLVSSVNFIGAGLSGEGFEKLRHVNSFRRQIYAVFEENEVLPGFLAFSFEDETHRMFLSFDEIRCFKCKSPAHLVANCPDARVEATAAQLVLSGASVGAPGGIPITADVRVPFSASPAEVGVAAATFVAAGAGRASGRAGGGVREKRLASVSSVDDGDSISDTSMPPPSSKQGRKKKIKSAPLEPDPVDALNSIQYHFFPDSDISPLPFHAFRKFLNECKGSSDPLKIAYTFTKDVRGLINIIEKVTPEIEHRALLERCIRLSKRLKAQLQSESDMEVNDTLKK